MRKYRKSIWSNVFFVFFTSVFAGIIFIFLISLVFSALAFFVFKNMMFAKIFTIASLGAGGFISGRICGRYRRKHGLINGVLCGIIIYCVIFLISVSVGESADIKKMLLLAITGAFGGISGVNSERPKNLM